jgi:putative phosphoesterase
MMEPNITQLYEKLKFDGYDCLYSKHEEGLAHFNQEAYKPKLPMVRWKVGGRIPDYECPSKDHVLVVSDTHDDVVAMEYVIKMANAMGIKFMIHGGDIVHNGMMATFKDFRGRIFGVLGNHDRLNAAHYIYEHPQTDLKWDLNRFSIYGKKFVLTHGESIPEMGRIVDEEKTGWNFLIYGHWHAPCFFQRDYNCVINPGMFTTAEPVFLLLNIHKPEESVYVKLEPRLGDVVEQEEETLGAIAV